MSELKEAMENYRKLARGDMTGKELAAFVKLDSAIMNCVGSYPKIYCDGCGEARPLITDRLRSKHGALDLVCGECKLIISTLHGKALSHPIIGEAD